MSSLLGEALAVLSALSFAMFNVVISGTAGSRGDKGVLFSVVVTIGFSLVLFLVLEAGQISIDATMDTAAGLGFFVFAGLSAMVFGRTLVFNSIRRLGATRASAVKRLNPFFSVLLAAVFLSEPVTAHDLAGLVAIGFAFGLLMRDSYLKSAAGDPAVGTAGPLAYAIGAGAAFAYAVAYIGRKAGLELLDAPALGIFVSALSGFLGFGILAIAAPRYRPMFRGLFQNIDRHVMAAAIFVSMGQILMFAALAYESVSTVVMISSLEIFFSIFLSTVVFRTERRPDSSILLPASLAIAGVLLVASG
jgi:drug/metabolite transporter (DMT)-like permease